MPKITLAEPWTYRTPLVTADFPAGEHEVSDEIAAAALSEASAALIEKEETADGHRPAKARSSRRSDPTEG